MWECARCRKIMKSSGQHRVIRTKSGHYRVAGHCSECAQRHDSDKTTQFAWTTCLLALGLSVATGLVSYTFMLGW